MNELQLRMIEDKVKSSEKELSLMYAQIEIVNKIKAVIEKYDLTIGYYESSLNIRYILGKKEHVAGTAWQIFEEIDEILNTTGISQYTFESSKEYDITASKVRVPVRLVTYYGKSETCKMVEVTKTITTHKLVCED